MPTDPTRQPEFDAALAEVVARADRPADVNRLVAAAIRLRDAHRSLHGVTPAPTAAATTTAHTSADLPGRAPTCNVEPWCRGDHGEHEPDVRGTFTPRLHRRKLSSWVTLGRLELAPNEQPQPGDHDTVVWLGHGGDVDEELTLDGAAELAAALTTAVELARGAARPTMPCTFCGQRFTGRDMVDHLTMHRDVDDELSEWTPAMLDRLGAMVDETPPSDPLAVLTARERDILAALVTGKTNADIAAAMWLSPKTVMHHSVSIYRKLGVRGRVEAVAVAINAGLEPLGGDR